VGLVGAVALVLGLAAPAAAADTAETLDVTAAVAADGTLAVTTALTFADAAPDPVVQSFATSINLGTDRRLAYTVSDITALVDGQAATAAIEEKDGRTIVSVATGGSPGPVTLSYIVQGVTRANPDGSIRFSWSVLQGLSVAVNNISGKVDLPPGVIDYVCESGSPSALTTCNAYTGGTHGSNAMTFADGPRPAGDLITVGAVFEAGAVPETARYVDVWSLARAFSLGWDRIGLAAGLLVIGCLAFFGLNRRLRHRVTSTLPTPIAELATDDEGYTTFALMDAVHPGMVGTLMDQSVDPTDVLATLVDLAVRGHLRITELPRPTAYAVPDWTLTRRESPDRLEEYERRLLDAVAPPGAVTHVSELTAAVIPAIGQVQSALYDRVVQTGWFARRPGTRSRWTFLAWLGLGLSLLASAALIIWTTWAVLGFAGVAVFIVALFLVQDAPLLTPAGASALAGLGEFAGQLHSVPTTLRPDDALVDASAILPYAIVLGGWDRWLEALVSANAEDVVDATELDWYHGPEGWRFHDLPACLGAFITVVIGRLFARA
jgi:hypothetical protein